MAVQIYGKNPCREVLASGRPVRQAILRRGTHRDILTELERRGVAVTILDADVFARSYPEQSQGIVFEVDDYLTLTLEAALAKHAAIAKPFYLMLDGISDPHNLGAILRSAEAGGVTAVILPKDRSVGITGTVAKAASGALEYIDVIVVTNLAQTVETLKKKGFWIVGTAIEAQRSYVEIDVTTPLCVIIGSEGKGIGRLLSERVDYAVRIPMAGRANSLNASVAAGIIIFEVLRKKG